MRIFAIAVLSVGAMLAVPTQSSAQVIRPAANEFAIKSMVTQVHSRYRYGYRRHYYRPRYYAPYYVQPYYAPYYAYPYYAPYYAAPYYAQQYYARPYARPYYRRPYYVLGYYWR